MTQPKPYKKVHIEISNICNLQCSFCPEVAREKHIMSVDKFLDIAQQLEPLVEEVALHLMGEPLNHPQFARIIDVCSDVGLPINLTTNGLLLQGARAEKALSKTVRQINMSLQSYGSNFGIKGLSQYLGKIAHFCERALSERPDLYLNLRLWDQNEHQEPNEEAGVFVRAWLREAFGVDLSRVDVRRKKSLHIKGRLYVHMDSRFVWPAPDLPFLSETGFCYGLISHFGILADGTVVPCCLDKEGHIPLGDASISPLEDILKSDKASHMRSGFLQGELRDPLCQRCPFVTRFTKKAKRLRLAARNPQSV